MLVSLCIISISSLNNMCHSCLSWYHFSFISVLFQSQINLISLSHLTLMSFSSHSYISFTSLSYQFQHILLSISSYSHTYLIFLISESSHLSVWHVTFDLGSSITTLNHIFTQLNPWYSDLIAWPASMTCHREELVDQLQRDLSSRKELVDQR